MVQPDKYQVGLRTTTSIDSCHPSQASAFSAPTAADIETNHLLLEQGRRNVL